MKNIVFLLSLVFFFACDQKQTNTADVTASTSTTTAKQSNQLSIDSSDTQEIPMTTISWDRPNHDFGNITEGDVVTTVFTITNTGDNPLIINNAKGSCGCTVPKVEKNIPIAPGATTDIEVQFSSKGRPGVNSKNVDLFGNFDPSPSRATIKASVAKAAGAASTGGPAVATPAVDPHAGHNH